MSRFFNVQRQQSVYFHFNLAGEGSIVERGTQNAIIGISVSLLLHVELYGSYMKNAAAVVWR